MDNRDEIVVLQKKLDNTTELLIDLVNTLKEERIGLSMEMYSLLERWDQRNREIINRPYYG